MKVSLAKENNATAFEEANTGVAKSSPMDLLLKSPPPNPDSTARVHELKNAKLERHNHAETGFPTKPTWMTPLASHTQAKYTETTQAKCTKTMTERSNK